MEIGKEIEAILADIPVEERERFLAQHKRVQEVREANGINAPEKLSGAMEPKKKCPALAPCLRCRREVIEVKQVGKLMVRSAAFCPECEALQAQAAAQEAAQEAAQAAAQLRKWRAENMGILLAKSGVPKIFQACTLTNFEGKKPDDERPVYLSGPTGVGKTHLAVGYMRAWVLDNGGRGGRAKFLRVMDLFREIKATFRPDSPASEAEIIGRYAKIHFLLLDDLGTEIPTDFAQSVLYDLVDQRYGADLGATTIITSNRSLEEIDRVYHPRLASRIAQMGAEFLMAGEDRRIVNHFKRTLH